MYTRIAVEEIHETDLGPCFAQVAPPDDGHDSVRLDFTIERTPPLHVHFDNATRAEVDGLPVEGHVVPSSASEHSARDGEPADEPSGITHRAAWSIFVSRRHAFASYPLSIRWIRPETGGSLVGAWSLPSSGIHRIAARGLLEQFDEAITRIPEEGKRVWLKLDLATSIHDAIDLDAVAARLGGGHYKPLLEAVIPANREKLKRRLERRAKDRACLYAAGIPCNTRVLDDVDDLRGTAEAATRLLVAVLGMPSRDRAVDIVKFGAGLLRNPCAPPGGQMNIEPNSFAVAAFAEVFDIACSESTFLDSEHVCAARFYRQAFAAIIRPFSTCYRSRLGRYARKYSHTNYQAKWTEQRAGEHWDEFHGLSDEAMQRRWAEDLFHAVRDESRVHRVLSAR